MYLGSDFSFPPEKSQLVCVCVCILQGAHWIQTNAEPMYSVNPHPIYGPTKTILNPTTSRFLLSFFFVASPRFFPFPVFATPVQGTLILHLVSNEDVER